MKRILVLHTGGTIAMKEDTLTGGVSPDVSNPLMDAPIHIDDDVELIVEDIFNIPSPHMTPKEMLQLKERIQLAHLSGVDGVVITHGTDTLEETAFFLDTTIGGQLPIVVTGAMRSSNEIGSDGLYNFESAIRVAKSPDALGKGVLVVMNDEIHSARYVTKTHTTNIATFRTPTLLIDVNRDKAEGEALDLLDGMSWGQENIKVWAGEYSECKDADIVVITAGVNQKPGQTRLELIDANQ